MIIDVTQGTEEWHLQRSGMPTASKASCLVTSDGTPSKSLNGYADELAAEMFAGKPLDRFKGNSSTERGHELEPLARSAYSFETDNDVTEVGFILSESGLYGCSPDGMVGDDGLVEIKCHEAKAHTSAILYWRKHSKAPTSHLAQCWFQMLVTGRKWCDLYFWHPDLPSIKCRLTSDGIPETLPKQIDACLKRRDSTLEILRSI